MTILQAFGLGYLTLSAFATLVLCCACVVGKRYDATVTVRSK